MRSNHFALSLSLLLTIFALAIAVGPALSGAGTTGSPARSDAITAARFSLVVDGVSMSFQSISGLTCETDVVEYRDGTDPASAPRLQPGLTRCGPVTLTRGLSSASDLWSWYASALDGEAERKDVAVRILDEDRSTAALYFLYNSWISKYEGPSLNAEGNEVAMEELTLQTERIERDLSITG